MNKNAEIEKLKELLNRDKLRNINLLNVIADYSLSSFELFGDSTFVRCTTDRDWVFFCSSSKNELQELAGKLSKKDKNFASIEDWMLQILIEKKEVKWKLSVMQFYLPDEVSLPSSTANLSLLTLSDAAAIYEYSDYKEYISTNYVEERIKRNAGAGIRVDGKLVAWGLTQDDGGLGFLHVLDDYRRKGYGTEVTFSLIEQVRQKGKIPFTYIEEDNFKSLNLVAKFGFVKQKKIHWFEIK